MTVIWALGSNRAQKDCLFTVPVDRQSGPGGIVPGGEKKPRELPVP